MSKRIERANSEILRCISEIVHNKMNDPRIDDFVMISEANVTPDFKFCKVKVMLLEKDFQKADQIISILQKSEGFIKRELKEMIHMPQVPKLIFVFDNSTKNVIRVEELLKSIKLPPEEE